MKNKSKIILFSSVTVVLLALLVLTKPKKGKEQPEPQTEEVQQPQPSIKEEWQEYDNNRDLLYGSTDKNDSTVTLEYKKELISDPIQEPSSLSDFESLSRYPAPSYVSDKEDTLIYRKGIYIRIGFQEEPKQDTIIVDGKKYIPVL